MVPTRKKNLLRKNRKKAKQMKFILGVFGMTIFLVGLFFMGKQFFPGKKVADETKAKTTEKVKQETLKSSGTIATTSSSEKQDLTQLMPHKNHNYGAEAYSYDTKLMRQYIFGKAPYDGKRLVFLTFDDGPNTTMTPRILDCLKENNVPATFFLVGKNISPETAPILKRQLAEGHGLAMHSFSHDYDALYPNRVGNGEKILGEAQATEAALQKYLGSDFFTPVWRYPGGHMSWKNLEAADQLLAEKGYQWMDWNAAPGDAMPTGERPTTVDGMVAYNEKSLTEFPDHHVHVVLMHDAFDKELTLASLPKIIQFFKERDYTFGILS